MVHGCIVYAERAEAAAVLCGTMPVLSVHHFSGNSKTRYKKLFTHVESHASAVSLLESREWRYIYKSDQQLLFAHYCHVLCTHGSCNCCFSNIVDLIRFNLWHVLINGQMYFLWSFSSPFLVPPLNLENAGECCKAQ